MKIPISKRIEFARWSLNGDRLRAARKSAGLTLEQLGDLCSWSKQYQSKLENGAAGSVAFATVRKLREALGEHGVNVK